MTRIPKRKSESKRDVALAEVVRIDGKPPRKAKAANERNTFEFMRCVFALDLPRVNQTAKMLLLYIHYRDGIGHGCYASADTIRRELCIGDYRTLRTAVAVLEEHGLIEFVPGTRGRGKTSRYRIRDIPYSEKVENSTFKPPEKVENSTYSGGSKRCDSPGKRCNSTRQTKKEPTPVGVVGSLLKPGQQVLALAQGAAFFKLRLHKFDPAAPEAWHRGDLIELWWTEDHRQSKSASLNCVDAWLEKCGVGVLAKGHDERFAVACLLAFVRWALFECKRKLTVEWLGEQYTSRENGAGWHLEPERDLVIVEGQVVKRCDDNPKLSATRSPKQETAR